MFFLRLDKIPLLISGIGLMKYFYLPGTSTLDSSRFLRIHFLLFLPVFYPSIGCFTMEQKQKSCWSS